MKKIAIMLPIALISGGAGIYLLYMFFASMKTGTNFIFLVISLVFFTVSVVLLIIITNPRNKDTTIADQTKVYEKTLDKLEKNSAVVAEWSKTNEQRDKLELLKMAANVKEAEDEAAAG